MSEKNMPTPAKRAVQWAKRHGRPMDATVIEAYLAGNNALARSKVKPLVDTLTTAVVAERTNFDLPHDWIHEASALIGSPVGEQYQPKRAQPSEVAALRHAHDALLSERDEMRRAMDGLEHALSEAKAIAEKEARVRDALVKFVEDFFFYGGNWTAKTFASVQTQARELLVSVGRCPRCDGTTTIMEQSTGEPGCKCGQLHCTECGEDPVVFAGAIPPSSPRRTTACPDCAAINLARGEGGGL